MLPTEPPAGGGSRRRLAVLAVVLILAVVGAAIGLIVSRVGGGSDSSARRREADPSTAFAVGTARPADRPTRCSTALDIANLFPGSPTRTTKGDAANRLIDAIFTSDPRPARHCRRHHTRGSAT